MLKKIWKSLFVAALLHSCAVKVPNIRVCAPVEGVPGVAALCRATNTDQKWRLNIDEWFDFLYAQGERPNPKKPGEKLPAKGPALAVSSEDWQLNETAIGQLCVDGKCNYDQQQLFNKVTGRIEGLIEDTSPQVKEEGK